MSHSLRLQRRRVRQASGRPARGGPLAALAALLPFAVALGNLIPTASLPSALAQPQLVQPAGAQQQPFDLPLNMVAEARQVYNQVQDYQCLLITQERIKGKLLPEQVIQLDFRKNPFSVHMKWVGKEQTGQEVCFVMGKNQNKMRVMSSGVFGGLGWLTIPVDDPKVMQHSRHTINEAGFGNLLERCAKGWEAERTMNKTNVQVAEYEYNKRRCVRVETVHTAKDPTFYSYRTVIFFDKETKLPVRMECYDWPRPGGPQDGELMECFSYIDLRFNVNLPDALFNH